MGRWKYFKLEEFKCPCCGRVAMDYDFIDKLDEARAIANIPFIITSGYRCEKHNKEVGGKYNSSHLVGKAVDIEVKNSYERFKILQALIKVGFKRIGIANNFIHVDNDINDKPCPVIWLY